MRYIIGGLEVTKKIFEEEELNRHLQEIKLNNLKKQARKDLFKRIVDLRDDYLKTNDKHSTKLNANEETYMDILTLDQMCFVEGKEMILGMELLIGDNNHITLS